MDTLTTIIDTNMKEHRRGLIHEMFSRMKQYNVVAREMQGRKIRVSDDHWVIDFASCNYLGLDLDPEMEEWVGSSIKKWGIHPSWCRLVASPYIYNELEERLADLLGTETTLVFPTVTLISIGVIPALVGKGGVMFLDKSAHETMYEAAKIARDSGATLVSFPQDDFQKLEELLQVHRDNPRKVILVDGIYSMTGDYANIPLLSSLAQKYHAVVYVDDAHGFGVIGEKPDDIMPLGYKGNGLVRYFGSSYENVIYVGGCSKAYSSLAAFVACTDTLRTFLQAFATPYDLSGPCPTASLATMLKGLDINNKRGDQLRKTLWARTSEVIVGLRQLGFTVMNKTGYPIVSVHIGDTEELIETANLLFDEGILVTVAPYPMMPKGSECHRITVTAANTSAETDELLATFAKVKKYLDDHNR